MCAAWVCIVCSNISEEEFKFLARKGLGTHWFCKKCDEASIDGLKKTKTLQDKMRCTEQGTLPKKKLMKPHREETKKCNNFRHTRGFYPI